MSNVSEVLAQAKAEDRAALIGYLPAGFPTVERSIEAMVALIESGADIVEVGLPYTDPLMDGPVIQNAATKALEAGFRVSNVFDAATAITAAGGASVVMTYWNPVLRYGVEKFATDLEASGASGLITPDLVPDEGADWLQASEAHDLDRIFLVAPSSTTERLASTTAVTRGFVYAASLMGVTGARSSVGEQAQVLVERTREVTDLPVCVGLGVSTPEQASQVARFADGVIVGSALVRCLLENESFEAGLAELRTLTAELAAAVRRS